MHGAFLLVWFWRKIILVVGVPGRCRFCGPSDHGRRRRPVLQSDGGWLHMGRLISIEGGPFSVVMDPAPGPLGLRRARRRAQGRDLAAADLARQFALRRERRRLGAPRRRLRRRDWRRDVDSSLWRAPVERAGDAVPAGVDGGHGSRGALPVEASTASGACWAAASLVQADSFPARRRRRGLRRELGRSPHRFGRQWRLPRRLDRPEMPPELDNAVFASVLQPLAS